jgi:hypothetical protein
MIYSFSGLEETTHMTSLRLLKLCWSRQQLQGSILCTICVLYVCTDRAGRVMEAIEWPSKELDIQR